MYHRTLTFRNDFLYGTGGGLYRPDSGTRRPASMDFSTDRADNYASMAKLAPLGLLARTLALALALGPWLPGCADRDESRDVRLERLEARIDRLDERLARTEARAAATGESEALGGVDSDPITSAIRRIDPERRKRILKRFSGMRRRMEKMSEGADLTAEPGTPEFRRGLLLEMLRQQNRDGAFGRRGADDDGASQGGAEDYADDAG